MSDYPKPNPVCLMCGKEMACIKNGVIVENGAVQWRGDLFKCPKCQRSVVTAFGDGEDIKYPIDTSCIHVDNL